MTMLAKSVDALAAQLGDISGLERVVREAGELCRRVTGGLERCSRADLAELQKSLETLGRTISTIDVAVHRRVTALKAEP